MDHFGFFGRDAAGCKSLITSDAVDPDWAVEAMEHVGWYLQQLPAPAVEALQVQLDRVVDYAKKEQWRDEVIEFLEDFLSNLGIGDASVD